MRPATAYATQSGDGEVRGTHLRMHPAFEVPVPGEHRDHVEVLFLDRGRHIADQRPGVADAGRAAVTDERESELVEVRREPRPVQVVRHDA